MSNSNDGLFSEDKPARPKLVIVGCGSSGLVTLKYAVEQLPEWDIVCFEQTDSILGCWGRPQPGFVSTSSKFGTQFACFTEYEPQVVQDGTVERKFADFFRDDEFGNYLGRFAQRFNLNQWIQTQTTVLQVEGTSGQQWRVITERKGVQNSICCDALIVCTGLVNQIQNLDCRCPVASSVSDAMKIENRRVVVVGGGESGVDVARRLAEPKLNNEVFLSLRSGIRVSPRYHPIRGVPSDFLRNRLLLSFHPLLRNSLGELFVRLRIRFRKAMGRLFGGQELTSPDHHSSCEEIRRFWDLKLTVAASDRLFNTYHNKSDDFLDSVADGRIQIVGGSVDQQFQTFYEFDCEDTIDVGPEIVVPAVGFSSGLAAIGAGKMRLCDFYLGCLHVEHANLFAIGFARPVIGSIPPISEMQAQLVCSLLSKTIARPDDLASRHQQDRQQVSSQFPTLNSESVYPVEMFPYCDRLAKWMGCFPSWKQVGSVSGWIRLMLSPATTRHYHFTDQTIFKARIFLPMVLVVLLLLMKPVDWVIKSGSVFSRFCGRLNGKRSN